MRRLHPGYQLRVKPCPAAFSAGFYWYGSKRKVQVGHPVGYKTLSLAMSHPTLVSYWKRPQKNHLIHHLDISIQCFLHTLKKEEEPLNTPSGECVDDKLHVDVVPSSLWSMPYLAQKMASHP